MPDEATEEERDDARAAPDEIRRAQWIEGALTAAIFAFVAAGQWLLGRRGQAIALLAIPWAAMALVALFGRWFTYRVRDRHEGAMARSSVATLMFVSALALLYHAERYYEPDDSSGLWTLSLAGASVMTLLAIASSAGLRWRWLLIAGFFLKAALYSAGAAMAINAIFDHAHAPSKILGIDGKHSSSGSRGSTDYYLDGHYLDYPDHGTSIYVSGWWYEQKKKGDLVCQYHHPGRLRMPWTFVSECADSALADHLKTLIEYGEQRIAKTLASNGVDDDMIRRRASARLRSGAATFDGTESRRQIDKLVEAALEAEGYVLVHKAAGKETK